MDGGNGACLEGACVRVHRPSGASTYGSGGLPGRQRQDRFHTNRDSGNFDIYSVNPDGTGATRLTTNAAQDLEPAWSPDGSEIGFVSLRDGNYEIYTMNADGTSQTRITTNPAADVQPAWSPDGTKIVFSTDRD